MMTWSQLGFQDSISPMMEEFIFFHDFIMLILIMIIMFVSVMMFSSISNKYINKFLLESQLLECIWTLFPGLILIYIAIPSLTLLYLFEESILSTLTVKAMGHQWYWSYEYWDFLHNKEVFNFDSYMIKIENEDNFQSNFRLLDVDSRLVLPYMANIRILVSSSDVLHAWTIPSLGIKADATPGRLNQLNFISQRSGVYFGQCSEICGANHSFMPIVLELINCNDFIKFLSN